MSENEHIEAAASQPSEAPKADAPAEEAPKAKKEPKSAVPVVKIKNTMHEIETMLLAEQNNSDKFPEFGPGDIVRIHVRIKEGSKERIQVYEGTVLCFKHGMNRKTFIVRRVTDGISIERVFVFHSPAIAKVEVIRRASVRHAKLYFLRGRFGKAARLKEKILRKGEKK